MRIVIVSLYFPPKIGGVENVMFGLAQQWHKTGHDVTVFTVTPGDDYYGFNLIRSLSFWKLLLATRKCDVFFEANISLKTCLIGILCKSKWFVVHHLTYTHVQRWQEIVKNMLTYFSNNISVSQYIAETLKGRSVVIPNFFASEFRRIETIGKTKDLAFVGRLVSDKGVGDLIKALVILKERGIRVSCSIIGEGPEEETIGILIREANLEGSVKLMGPLRGDSLVSEMNAHKLMAVPSKWPEPFGLVVLEGLACGCRIVCSDSGGLPEAANGFAMLYPCQDVNALAGSIQDMLAAGKYHPEEYKLVQEYLMKRSSVAISERYIQFFNLRIRSKS